jgi:hypothetical protein
MMPLYYYYGEFSRFCVWKMGIAESFIGIFVEVKTRFQWTFVNHWKSPVNSCVEVDGRPLGSVASILSTVGQQGPGPDFSRTSDFNRTSG